ASEECKREFLESLTESEFEELISGINGILRGKKKDDWEIDGGDVKLVPGTQNPDPEVIPPRAKDKLGLFGDLYEGMKTMIEDKRGIEDIALLLSSGINEVHSYEDANGRTSRLIYTLLTENFDDAGQEKMKSILGEYGSFHVDINPGLIRSERDDIIFSEIGVNDPAHNPRKITNLFRFSWEDMAFQSGITDSMKQNFKNLCRDSKYGFYAAFKVISRYPDPSSFLKVYDSRSVILIEKLASDFNKDQMNELMEEYWFIKRRLVEILIDLVVHPEKPEYQTQEEGKAMTILEKFKLRIRQNQEKNKKSE
ncbi:MAG: hypothetical protein Q7R86_02425, partial [bacterium]|nr:hypothetical protein [bacterium]